MKPLANLFRCAGFCALVASLAGCGGSQAQSNAVLPMRGNAPGQASAAHSWVARRARTGNLLYVSRYGLGEVSVFSYPKGAPVGTLTGFETPEGLCSNKNGDIFVVDETAQQVVEYAHGGTSPIATLDDSGNLPHGCAIDPTSGDLAVVGGGPPGNVAIYPQAKGSPTVYQDGSAEYFSYCTYDDQGDLFTVDVYGDNNPGNIVELSQGSTSFADISVDHRFNEGIHAIQWDGQYLAVGDPSGNQHGAATIYQVSISGSTGNVINTIELRTRQNTNPKSGVQFWIQGHTIVSPERFEKRIGLWRYPAGGKPKRTIMLSGGPLLGLTVSLGP